MAKITNAKAMAKVEKGEMMMGMQAMALATTRMLKGYRAWSMANREGPKMKGQQKKQLKFAKQLYLSVPFPETRPPWMQVSKITSKSAEKQGKWYLTVLVMS